MNDELTLIEKCPACFGSGQRTGVGGSDQSALPKRGGPSSILRCQRCEGAGRRTMADRIDPTGKDVFALYGVTSNTRCEKRPKTTK